MALPENITAEAMLTAIEAAIAELTVADPNWPKQSGFRVLGQIDAEPGALPEIVETMAVTVDLPDSVNSQRLASLSTAWVDDEVVVTLWYRLGSVVDLTRWRDAALAREREIRVAVTAQGQDAEHANRKWVRTTRRRSPDRQWWVIAQRFRFDRYDAIGGR